MRGGGVQIPPPACWGRGTAAEGGGGGAALQRAVSISAKLRGLRGGPSVSATRCHCPRWGRNFAIFAALLLAACSGSGPQPAASPTPPDLEAAAVERGLVRDPRTSDVTGLYARDTDRLCIVRDGTAYRIGAFVDYGDRVSCTGRGTAARSGSTLAIEFTGRDGATCSFAARFDGDRITFPATVPDSCARLCGPRASFAALEVERLSESAAEARALRSAEGVRLCS